MGKLVYSGKSVKEAAIAIGNYVKENWDSLPSDDTIVASSIQIKKSPSADSRTFLTKMQESANTTSTINFSNAS